MNAKAKALLALGAGVVLAWGLARGHEGHEGPARGSKVRADGTLPLTSEARTSLGLKVAPVEERSFDEVLVANGKVVAPWDARGFATSRVAGRVVDIAVKPWHRVEKGAVLATVESAELEDLGLALIDAGLRRGFLAETLARERALVAKGISAGKELIAIETDLAKVTNAQEVTRGKLVAIGLERGEIAERTAKRSPRRLLTVRAPRSGFVVHLDVSVGELIEPTKHLFEIHELSTVWVETKVLEPDIGRVHVGQEAIVRADSTVARGKVVVVAQEADEQSGAVLAYVEVPNAGGALRENLPAKVELVVARSIDAVAVPRKAVVSIGVERFVLLEEEPGVFRRRDVVLGKSDEGWAEALEGLYLGDRVVVAGQHELGSAFAAAGELRVSAAARKRLGVTDEEVDLGPLTEVAHVVGHVRVPTGHEGTATARVPGKIARLVARPGMRVKKGEALAELESLELENMELDLIQADLELGLATKNLERVRGLARQDIEPLAELLRLENEAQRHEALVASLSRKLRVVGVTEDEIALVRKKREPIRALPVLSPIDGVVSAPLAIEGQVVAVGTALYRVQDASIAWIEGAAVASDIARLRVGQPVRVRLPALPNEVLSGRVAFLGQVLDETSRALPVYVSVANDDGRLKPGLQATLDVDLGETGEPITAPVSSILPESGGHVAILVDGATFRRVPVELGPRRDDRSVEVVRGLFPGDRVVTTGAEEVRSALLSVR